MYNFLEAKARWKVPIAVSTSDNPTEPAAEKLLEEDSCIEIYYKIKRCTFIFVTHY